MFNREYYIKATEKIPEKYLLANIVSMRMRQLINGADPLVEDEGMAPIDIALKEIAEGMIEPRKEEIPSGDELFGQVD